MFPVLSQLSPSIIYYSAAPISGLQWVLVGTFCFIGLGFFHFKSTTSSSIYCNSDHEKNLISVFDANKPWGLEICVKLPHL